MVPTAYADLKNLIGGALHLSPDALHIHAGLILFLSGAALIRSERRFVHSLTLLVVLCLVGELFDLSHDFSRGYRLRWLNGVKDFINTVFWPVVWVAGGPLVARILRLGRARSIPATGR